MSSECWNWMSNLTFCDEVSIHLLKQKNSFKHFRRNFCFFLHSNLVPWITPHLSEGIDKRMICLSMFLHSKLFDNLPVCLRTVPDIVRTIDEMALVIRHTFSKCLPLFLEFVKIAIITKSQRLEIWRTDYKEKGLKERAKKFTLYLTHKNIFEEKYIFDAWNFPIFRTYFECWFFPSWHYPAWKKERKCNNLRTLIILAQKRNATANNWIFKGCRQMSNVFHNPIFTNRKLNRSE